MSVRRRKGEGSISRYHRPGCTGPDNCQCGWRARITVTVNGRRIRKTLYAPTEKAILRKVKVLTAEEAAGTIRTAAPVTVAAWLESWYATTARKLKINTRQGYRSKLNTYLIPQLGHHRIDRLQPRHVREMYDTMRERGLSEATCRQTHAILHRALKMAVREGVVAKNVCDQVDAPETTTHKRKSLSVEDAWKVLRVAGDDPRYWLALTCGIRQGEALALRWSDVHLTDDVFSYILVERSVSWEHKVGPVFDKPKNREARVVPLIPQVTARMALARAKAVAAGRGADDLVFVGSTGQPLQPHVDWMRWKVTLEMAGVEHVALHAARNTTSQLLENAGVLPRAAAQILGHKHVDMTHHYQTGNLVAAVDGMRALEAYMGAMDEQATG